MPQIPVIQTAAPKAPPKASSPGSPGSKEQSRFSPHLKKALSGNKSHKQVDRKEIAQNDSPATNKKNLTEAKEKIRQSPEPKKTANDTDTDTEATAADGMPTDSSKKSLEQTIFAPLCTETSPASTKAAPAAIAAKIPVVSAEIAKNEAVAPQLEKAEIAPIRKSASAGPEDSLISQLQKIISSSDERGTVTISRVDKSSAVISPAIDLPSNLKILNQSGMSTVAQAESTSPGKPLAGLFSGNGAVSHAAEAKTAQVSATSLAHESPLSGILAAAGDDMEKVAGKPADHLTGNRHGIQQQFIDAKIDRQNLGESRQDFQENKQEDKLFQHTLSSSPTSGLSAASDQTSTFSQNVAAAQPTTTHPTTVTAQPIILPSGTMVHEDEIIRQMTEKFQVSGKHTDSRINIKLHPAELGALKIDLSVKDGAIRANVVAQSHHTMQILEKNIQKLRAVLENQGFTVDQIAVSAESESVGGFDLFDQQLFSKNDETPTFSQGSPANTAGIVFEDSVHAALAGNTGVNVKI